MSQTNHTAVLDAWLDHLHDGSPTNSPLLADQLQRDPALAAALAHDESLDALLRSSTYLAESGEAFVAEWEARAALAGEVPIAEPPIAEPPVAHECLSEPPICLAAPTVSLAEAPSKDAHHLTWLAVGLATSLALTAAVVITWWNSSQFPKPNTNVEHSVVQSQQAPVVPETPAVETNPQIPELPGRFVDLKQGRAIPEAPAVHQRKPSAQPSELVTTPVVWSQGGPQRDQLSRGLHRLDQGEARVLWNGSTPIQVSAPARLEVRPDDALVLHEGKVTVSGAEVAAPGAIVTPTSRIDGPAANVQISVSEDGHTAVIVLAGAAQIHPGLSATATASAGLPLSAEKWTRAEVPPVTTAGAAPVAVCELSGPNSAFCGVVSLNGQTLQFNSPEEFAEFRGDFEAQLAENFAGLTEQWPALVQFLGGQGGGQIQLQQQEQGNVEDIRTLPQMMELMQRLQRQQAASVEKGAEKNPSKSKRSQLKKPPVKKPPVKTTPAERSPGERSPGEQQPRAFGAAGAAAGSGFGFGFGSAGGGGGGGSFGPGGGGGGGGALQQNGQSSFQGSISANGQEQKFNNPAEFEAARKRLFGPLAIPQPGGN